MEYVLEANGLCKRYHNFAALNGLDMHIPKGAIYGFVGRNGAGKTTLIRLICGLQEPTGGSFTLYGAKNTDERIGRCRRRMGAVVETPSIYLDMTAEENIRRCVGLFLDLNAKAVNGEISTNSVDLRGMIAALRLMTDGMAPNEAIAVNITNKCFDEYEYALVRDVVMTRFAQ